MSGVQTGAISGTVIDTQGAALPGAVVKTTVNGIPQVQVSNHYGEFRFLDLPVGTYIVEAQLEGFTPVTDPDVEVDNNKTTNIELKMQLAVSE
jgi:hypothetical protein